MPPKPLIKTQRLALSLYREGFGQAHIAKRIGVPPPTLKGWLTIADAVDPDFQDFIPVDEVRIITGLTANQLERLGRTGQVNTITRNGRRVIPKADVIMLKRRNGGRGSRTAIERQLT